MIPANKKILTIILVSIWLTDQYLLTRFFVYNDTNNHFTFEGLLAGIILIAIYQQNLLKKNDRAINTGMVILQEDRLLFHPVKCSNREILFTEIAQIRIGHLIGFPQHLILYLNGGQSVTYNLSMPHFWMKRINSLKNREISQVTVNTL
jgi:hypothetical protein